MTRSDARWMQERWEELARKDAEYFIWTDVARGDDFLASGRRDVERILGVASRFLSQRGRALEIGCGVGRLTLPMSHHFREIVAVDIAPTMLSKLAVNCSAAGVANVVGMHADAAWEGRGPIDFAYSRIVFQHIEAWAIIEDYFRRIASCLGDTGAFYAQFDTRPRGWSYHVKNALPDFLVPRAWIRGVRRIRRTPDEVVTLARAQGLVVEHIAGEGTADTTFVFTRAS